MSAPNFMTTNPIDVEMFQSGATVILNYNNVTFSSVTWLNSLDGFSHFSQVKYINFFFYPVVHSACHSFFGKGIREGSCISQPALQSV